jgi:methylmalonyl-CoA mutase
MSDSNKTSTDDLFNEFDPITREEWERKIKDDLQGQNYKNQLLWESDEGITALPFYMREDFNSQYDPDISAENLIQSESGKVIQPPSLAEDITTSDINQSNDLAHKIIQNGVHTLLLSADATSTDGLLGGDITGIPIQTQKTLKLLLDGIDLKTVALIIDSNTMPLLLSSMLLNEMDRQHLNQEDVCASFVYDPFTQAAKTGRWPHHPNTIRNIITETNRLPFRSLGIDGSFYHRCGATLVQEVGIALSIGSEFLAFAQKEGASLKKTSRSITMRLSSSSYYFPEIAKFRAMRRLWQTMVSAYDHEAGSHADLNIVAETSPWTKTIAEPYNNILRTVTESMAAIAGGADKVCIHPFDSRFRKPGNFSRRIARNIHHILTHESHFNKVYDPGAGSYYIEYLTEQIANKGWEFFQFIEKQGGFSEALEGRFIQMALDHSGKKKLEGIRKKTRIFVGSNHYPNPGENWPDNRFQQKPVNSLIETSEQPVQAISVPALQTGFKKGLSIGDTLSLVYSPQKQLFQPLEPWFANIELERIRTQTAQLEKHTDRSLKVFILSVGSSPIRNDRTRFTRNYLGSAGYDITEFNKVDSIAQAEKKLRTMNPDILVLAGSDQDYNKLVGIFCSTFQQDDFGNPVLLLAGNPGESADEYRGCGIDEFLWNGSDMVDTLNKIHQILVKRLS